METAETARTAHSDADADATTHVGAHPRSLDVHFLTLSNQLGPPPPIMAQQGITLRQGWSITDNYKLYQTLTIDIVCHLDYECLQ